MRNNCFEFTLESVDDIDKSILRYRYEIYEVAPDLSTILVKELYSTKNDTVVCNVDGIVIRRGYNYRIRVVAECFDNEKQVVYPSSFSDIFSMNGTNFPTVLFLQDDNNTKHDKITGTIQIDTHGSILTIDNQNPLIIQYQNSIGDVDRIIITDKSQYTLLDDKNTTYAISISKNNLLANDNYIFSVFGTIDLNDNTGPHKDSLLGTIIVRTKQPAELKANLSDVENPTSPIAFRLNLSDADPLVSSEYEASTMEYIEINLYNGDESAVQNSIPVATYTLKGTNGINYKSTLKDSLYGEGKYIQLTDADFGISSSLITSSKYTVEISTVRDYTKYGNKFVVKSNIKTFEKKAVLPDLNSIDKDNGLIVVPITRANLAQYVSDPAVIESYDIYDLNVILGYEVCAAYFDNSVFL